MASIELMFLCSFMFSSCVFCLHDVEMKYMTDEIQKQKEQIEQHKQLFRYCVMNTA